MADLESEEERWWTSAAQAAAQRACRMDHGMPDGRIIVARIFKNELEIE